MVISQINVARRLPFAAHEIKALLPNNDVFAAKK
jgi:hypothetical protein